MTPKITRARVEAATDRFLRRVELFEEGPDDEVDIDEVIARGVTLPILRRSWNTVLDNITFSLRDDGTLYLTEVMNSMHSSALTAINRSLSAYARENTDLLPLGHYAMDRMPVHIEDTSLKAFRQPQALVVAVEVGHRTVREVIRVANDQLVALEAQRFVAVCFFHGRVREGQRRIAALAVAFDREPHTDRVRVIAEMSFGNASVPASALDSLSTVPTLTEDAGRVVDLGPSPFEDVVVSTDETRWTLRDAPHNAAAFVVPLPGRPDLAIELWSVFVDTITDL